MLSLYHKNIDWRQKFRPFAEFYKSDLPCYKALEAERDLWEAWRNFKVQLSWSTHYSDRLHDFSVTIRRCDKDVYVNSFFSCTARIWNSLPTECFPFTHDLNGFKSRVHRHVLTVGFFLWRFLVSFHLFMLFFLVTPYLVVAVQSRTEWIPIIKKSVPIIYCRCFLVRVWFLSSVQLISHNQQILQCFN